MTFVLDLDLDIMKTYLRTVNEVSKSRHSKLRARTGQTHRQTHTDRRDQMHYHPVFAGGTYETLRKVFVHFIDNIYINHKF